MPFLVSTVPFVSYCPLLIIFLFHSLSLFLSFKCFFFPYFLLISISFLTVPLSNFSFFLRLYILKNLLHFTDYSGLAHTALCCRQPHKRTAGSVTLLIQITKREGSLLLTVLTYLRTYLLTHLLTYSLTYLLAYLLTYLLT